MQGAADSGRLNHSNRSPDCLLDWTKDTAASVSCCRRLRHPRSRRTWSDGGKKKPDGWVSPAARACVGREGRGGRAHEEITKDRTFLPGSVRCPLLLLRASFVSSINKEANSELFALFPLIFPSSLLSPSTLACSRSFTPHPFTVPLSSPNTCRAHCPPRWTGKPAWAGSCDHF